MRKTIAAHFTVSRRAWRQRTSLSRWWHHRLRHSQSSNVIAYLRWHCIQSSRRRKAGFGGRKADVWCATTRANGRTVYRAVHWLQLPAMPKYRRSWTLLWFIPVLRNVTTVRDQVFRGWRRTQRETLPMDERPVRRRWKRCWCLCSSRRTTSWPWSYSAIATRWWKKDCASEQPRTGSFTPAAISGINYIGLDLDPTSSKDCECMCSNWQTY